MYTAEVIVRKMQSASCFQIIEFFGERIRQASKASNCLTHGQVLSFHETGRDVARIGPSVAYPNYGLYHRRRRVPSGCVVLAVITIQLYHLREVGLSCEHILNTLLVEMKPVGCNLKAMLRCQSFAQAGQEFVCRFAVALADGVGRDQFCFRINCDKHPSIPKFCWIVCFYVALFLLAECPNLIRLNPFALQVPHLGIHQLYASFPGYYEETHDSVSVELSDAFGATNACSFDQEVNCQQCSVFRHCHCAEQPRMFFRMGLGALWAAKPLETITVLPEFPAPEIALGTFHG